MRVLQPMMGPNDKFKDKSLKVVAVENSASLRQLFSEVLRGLGFSNVQLVASIEDAHVLLETEPIDWLIVPLNPDQVINGLHTVRMVTSFDSLQGTMVSLLLEDSEKWVVSKAFEFGLLSYHHKAPNKDGLTAEFQNFLTKLELNSWDTTKTSASYLRAHLTELKAASDLLTLEKNLMELYPGDGQILIHLAKAQILSNMPDQARASLRQAEFICPEYAEQITAARNAIVETGLNPEIAISNAENQPAQNILGLTNAVLIDHDDATRAGLRSIFDELGCKSVFDFADGDTAHKWMEQNPEPSLIVMEWRIPKITGPALLQRIRSKGWVNVPIIILSSLLKTTDMAMIRELGVANLALKPLEKSSFLRTLIWTIQQDRMPSDMISTENKIRALLNGKQLSAADELIRQYVENPSTPIGRKAIIRAESAFAREQYLAARDLAIEAIKQSGESLFALNVLGKCLMTLREYESALKCFKKAQSISPMNIERLVTIAEVQAELGDSSEAKATLNTAKDIDPENNVIAEGAARVAIAAGSKGEARTALATLHSNINLVRYLNNKAVAHAKCGFAAEGLEIYEKTLVAIPSHELELIAVVRYNSVLAKIRMGDHRSALLELEQLLATKENRIHKKASGLKERIQDAISNGKDFNLAESESHPPAHSQPQTEESVQATPATSSTLIDAMMQLRPGEHCCYLLFKSTAAEGAALQKSMATAPKFKPRKALQRGETFKGSEGTKVAS